MPGIKISELNPTFQLNDDDVIPLARPGPGNGYTYKIYGSVFGKASDVSALQSRATNLESRATNLESGKVSKSGDSMTGKLTLDGDPTANLHAATKQYVDTQTTTVANNKVSKSGDSMTGKLTLDGDPTANLHAATKQYVDTAVTGAVGAIGKTWADWKCS
jgi:hypothetical protein